MVAGKTTERAPLALRPVPVPAPDADEPDCGDSDRGDAPDSSEPLSVPAPESGVLEPVGASIAASSMESWLTLVGAADVVATSSSESWISPVGLDGIICRESPAGREAASPDTRTWMPSAPPVTNGSVPAVEPLPSGPPPVSESTRYHSLHPDCSLTRMNTCVPSASAPPSQVSAVTMNGSTSSGWVRIAESSIHWESEAVERIPRRMGEIVDPPLAVSVKSSAPVATSVVSPVDVVRGRTWVSVPVPGVPSVPAFGNQSEENPGETSRLTESPSETTDGTDM